VEGLEEPQLLQAGAMAGGKGGQKNQKLN